MSFDNEKTLPHGWSKATIAELVGSDGVFIDGDWVESKDQDPHGDVRLIQLADVGDGKYQDRSSRFLTSGKAAELHCTFLTAGDVLIARMPEPLGRACIFPGDSKKAVTVVDVCIVRTGKTAANHRWLIWAINSPDFRNAISGLQSGTTRKRISRGNLSTLLLPIPPLGEQTRIADEIEKQLTRLEAAVVGLTRVQANLKRYRAAVLKAACEGRLVPTEAELARRQERSYEHASTLLERVLADRPQKRSPVEPDMTDPPPLPEGWSYASVDQMVSEITSGSRDWSPFYGRGSSVFLMAQNVRPGKLDLSFRQLVDPPRDDPSRTRSQVKEQDLLVTIVGANTGDVCRVSIALREHFVCQSVALMRPVLPETSVFLDLYLNSQEHGVKQFKRYIYGAGRPHLRFDQLMMTCLVVPPLAEQARIAADVERRLSLVDEIEAQIGRDLPRAKSLRQSLLKRAFAGALVPQDASDEPATTLLERIRTEKKAMTQTVRPRGRRKKEPQHVA